MRRLCRSALTRSTLGVAVARALRAGWAMLGVGFRDSLAGGQQPVSRSSGSSSTAAAERKGGFGLRGSRTPQSGRSSPQSPQPRSVQGRSPHRRPSIRLSVAITRPGRAVMIGGVGRKPCSSAPAGSRSRAGNRRPSSGGRECGRVGSPTWRHLRRRRSRGLLHTSALILRDLPSAAIKAIRMNPACGDSCVRSGHRCAAGHVRLHAPPTTASP